MDKILDFYHGKRVFLTGHTGFKGMWLSKILTMAGAEVTGFSLPSPTEQGARVLAECGALAEMRSVTGDVRDYNSLLAAFRESRPELVFHLAAQPIVLESYRDPLGTYATNVMGTVNLLECARQSALAGEPVRSLLNVTTDKVYENREWYWGYREDEPLDGYDPYSNSKSCSELVTHSYRRSFLAEAGTAVSTARAGNVIGGGDYAPHRIIPDAVEAALAGKTIPVRNPHSTRPYQHVLEPLFAYLLIAARQYESREMASEYNVGPDECDCVTTGKLMDIFCAAWGSGASWECRLAEQPHEAAFLKLDCSKLKQALGWKPCWHIEEAVRRCCDWAKADAEGQGRACMEQQIRDYMGVSR